MRRSGYYKFKRSSAEKNDVLKDYCTEWKLEMNSKKTKVMVFNRGNKLITTDFKLNNIQLENGKSFKYLGFTISAKNCSFLPIKNRSTRANRVLPYSDKFWRGFNLVMEENGIFGVDLIWSSRKLFKFGVDLIRQRRKKTRLS